MKKMWITGNILLALLLGSLLTPAAQASKVSGTQAMVPAATDISFLDDTKWVLIEEKSNYKVYKSEKIHPSGIIPLKVEAKLNYPLAKILAVLDQTQRKSEWVPNMMSATVVRQISPLEKVERGTYDAPWPVQDREFVVHIRAEANFDTRTVVAHMQSVSVPERPITKEYVRGETYNGNVTLTEVEKYKSTSLVMIFFNDFQGDLPKWIVNFVQKGWPSNFIKHLTKQLERKDIVIEEKFRPLLAPKS